MSNVIAVDFSINKDNVVDGPTGHVIHNSIDIRRSYKHYAKAMAVTFPTQPVMSLTKWVEDTKRLSAIINKLIKCEG